MEYHNHNHSPSGKLVEQPEFKKKSEKKFHSATQHQSQSTQSGNTLDKFIYHALSQVRDAVKEHPIEMAMLAIKIGKMLNRPHPPQRGPFQSSTMTKKIVGLGGLIITGGLLAFAGLRLRHYSQLRLMNSVS